MSGLHRQLDIERGSARLILHPGWLEGEWVVANQKMTGMRAYCVLIATLSGGAAWAGAAGAVPDLEGTWTNASLTRLERPAEYGNRRAY